MKSWNFGILFALIFGQQSSVRGSYYIADPRSIGNRYASIDNNNKEKDKSTLTINFGTYANYQGDDQKCPTLGSKFHFTIVAVTNHNYQTTRVQSPGLKSIPTSGDSSAKAVFTFDSNLPTKMPILKLNVTLLGIDSKSFDPKSCVLGTFNDCRLPIPFASQNSPLTTSCANIELERSCFRELKKTSLNYNFTYGCYDPNNEFGWGCTECKSYNNSARCNTCNTTTGTVQCCDGYDGASCYAVKTTTVISTETPLEEADHRKELYFWIVIGLTGLTGVLLLLCLICCCCTAYYRGRYIRTKKKQTVPLNAAQMSQVSGLNPPKVYSNNDNIHQQFQPKINHNYHRDDSELSLSDKDYGFKESPIISNNNNNNKNYQRNQAGGVRRNQPSLREPGSISGESISVTTSGTSGGRDVRPLASSSQPNTPPSRHLSAPPLSHLSLAPPKPILLSSERHLPPPPPPYGFGAAGGGGFQPTPPLNSQFSHTPGSMGRFPSAATTSSPNVNTTSAADANDDEYDKPDTYV